MFIDTGADISLTSKVIYDQIVDQPELVQDNVDLFSVNGTSLPSLGKSEFVIKLESRVYRHTVVVVENFSYDFILRKDFLIAHKAAIDFGNSLLIIPDLVVKFYLPKRKFIVSTISDIRLSVKSTLAVQTELSKDIGNSDLFVDGGFLEDNQLFVARILTKVHPHNNKITVQVTNLVDHSVFLTKGTEIAEVTPFVEK